jgi:hypothetical protein
MADENNESPPETPHFTTEDASDAGPEDEPSVAPDLGGPLPAPKESAADTTDIADEMTKTAIKGAHT